MLLEKFILNKINEFIKWINKIYNYFIKQKYV